MCSYYFITMSQKLILYLDAVFHTYAFIEVIEIQKKHLANLLVKSPFQLFFDLHFYLLIVSSNTSISFFPI